MKSNIQGLVKSLDLKQAQGMLQGVAGKSLFEIKGLGFECILGPGSAFAVINRD